MHSADNCHSATLSCTVVPVRQDALGPDGVHYSPLGQQVVYQGFMQLLHKHFPQLRCDPCSTYCVYKLYLTVLYLVLAVRVVAGQEEKEPNLLRLLLAPRTFAEVAV
jgi:hypothetical protein